MTEGNIISYYVAKEKQKRVRVFADGIDWEHHLENDSNGVVVYPSEKALREHAEHDLDECGIVELEIKLIDWTTDQKLP